MKTVYLFEKDGMPWADVAPPHTGSWREVVVRTPSEALELSADNAFGDRASAVFLRVADMLISASRDVRVPESPQRNFLGRMKWLFTGK